MTFPKSKTKLLLSLEDFYTGPNNVITSLDVQNITDKSATVTWNPLEMGMGCATSFLIKQNMFSFEVEPHKVLTTWRSLQPCNIYSLEVFPKFHGKLGKGTSKTYSTFPNSKSFDSWIDATENKIIWQYHRNLMTCDDSLMNIQYEFSVTLCPLYENTEHFYIIPITKDCKSLQGCFIDINYLQKQIEETINIESNETYNVNLRGVFRMKDAQRISINILSNLAVKSNNDRKLSIVSQFKTKCGTQEKETTIKPILTTNPKSDEYISNPHHDSESHNSTLITVAFVASVFVTVSIFSFYVYHNQVKKHVKRLSNRVNRLSQNMAPHYAQYFQGPMQERISIVNS